MRSIWILATVVACGGGGAGSTGSGSTVTSPVVPVERPPVRFGDCAGPATTWVSGPRPLPLVDGNPDETSEPVGALDPYVADDVPDAFGSLVGDPLAPARSFKIGRDSRPSVAIGLPVLAGGDDTAIVRRYIKRNINRIEYCYEQALIAKPELVGTVVATFAIDAAGKVSTSTADGVDAGIASCIAGVIKGIEFPASTANLHVVYPFDFRHAGEPHPEAPTVPTPIRPPTRDLFRKTGDDGRAAGSYRAGARNPLRAGEAAITACLPTGDGAFVVGLTYDASGAVTGATVEGLRPDAVACVLLAAKQVKRVTPGATDERCAVAFGAVEPPAIEIAATVAFGGATFGTVGELGGALVPIAPLAAALGKTHAADLAPSGPTVVVHSPLVIRPLDATPLAVVFRVMASVADAGDDFVLAGKRGATWRPLIELPSAFPLAPVPFGTGGTWKPVVGHGAGVGRDHPIVSIAVTADRYVRVMVEAGADGLDDVAPGPEQGKQLAAILGARKALLGKRADVVITGDPDASYGALVAAIDAAVAAGLVDWRIAPPTP